jgi:hypothetical protein
MEQENRQYILDIYNILKQNIIVSYTGPFDGQVLTTIGNNIQYAIRNHPQLTNKIFKIFIELAQNISYYSTELTKSGTEGHDCGVGILLIKELDDSFLFSTGNVSDNDKIKGVIEKIEVINSLDRDGLREFKRKKRSLPQGMHGAGNIGLIQVALSSGNPLIYKVIPIDEGTSFYTIAVKIDKQ